MEEAKLRTLDTTYGAEYWDTLDGGQGYQDSLMWADIAHAIWEVLVVDWTSDEDQSGRHSLLDVGAAFGFLVRHMRSRGVESWGVDISDYALEHAPDDVRGFLHLYDLCSGNDTFFGQERFTLASCIETMEHIPEESVGVALAAIRNVLKPGGRAVFTICVEGHHGWDSDPTHVTIRPREWWEEQLETAGFSRLYEAEHRLSRFWLFKNHNGVFVAERPA